MNEERLKEIEAVMAQPGFGWIDTTITDLVTEVRRLRGLLVKAEWTGGHEEEASGVQDTCLWCRSWVARGHTEACPAFKAKGVTR